MPTLAAQTPELAASACIATASANASTVAEIGRASMACFGTIDAACLSSSRASDPIAVCAARELAFWQSQLDAAWSSTLLVLGRSPRASDQIAAQKAWLTYREKACALADHVDPGTMPGGSSACKARATAARAFDLRAITASLSEH